MAAGRSARARNTPSTFSQSSRIKLTNDWHLITRTIVPLTDAVHIVPGTNPVGMGDILQSFFLSPAQPVSEIVIGAGPVFLYPTATRDEISANQFAAGPSSSRSSRRTASLLAFLRTIWRRKSWAKRPRRRLHTWRRRVDNRAASRPVGARQRELPSAVLFLPTPSQTTFTLQTESTYNWTAHQWTVPVEGGVSQVLKIGSQPISLAAMAKSWAVRPDGAPAWGARFVLRSCFPSDGSMRAKACPAAGDDIASAAKSLGAAQGTLRSALKAIFRKTDEKRQAKLVRLLTRVDV